MKYYVECSCIQQTVFKNQLIRLIYDRTVLDNEEFLENMDVFVNNWCPTLKDCPCKTDEDQEPCLCQPVNRICDKCKKRGRTTF